MTLKALVHIHITFVIIING